MPKRMYYPQCRSDDERRAAKQFAQMLTERPYDVGQQVALAEILEGHFRWSPERLSRFRDKWTPKQ